MQQLHEISRPLRVALAAGADPYLDRRDTARLKGISVRTLSRLIKRGLFPQGDWIAPRKRGWRLSVVQAAPQVPAAPPSGSLAKAA
jgi:predicted DNA-binding transcriptional regulator AlpA